RRSLEQARLAAATEKGLASLRSAFPRRGSSISDRRPCGPRVVRHVRSLEQARLAAIANDPAASPPIGNGGERGIRTPVTLSGKRTFQARALNHSAISPLLAAEGRFHALPKGGQGTKRWFRARAAQEAAKGRQRAGSEVTLSQRQLPGDRCHHSWGE